MTTPTIESRTVPVQSSDATAPNQAPPRASGDAPAETAEWILESPDLPLDDLVGRKPHPLSPAARKAFLAEKFVYTRNS